MPESLVIRLPAADDGLVEWVTVDHSDAGIGSPHSGQLGEAVAYAQNHKIIVLVPASKVLRLNATIPLKGNARIRQALPYALEEQIAGDVEKQHFSFGKKDTNGRLPIAVVEKAAVIHWLELLQ